MNTKFVFASVFAALSGLAGTASAGTDVHVRLNFDLHPAPVIVAPSYCPPAAPVVVVGYRHEEPRGYWKEVVVKSWIPARWVVSYGYRGRVDRNFLPGYFAYNTERVWVDFSRPNVEYRRG